MRGQLLVTLSHPCVLIDLTFANGPLARTPPRGGRGTESALYLWKTRGSKLQVRENGGISGVFPLGNVSRLLRHSALFSTNKLFNSLAAGRRHDSIHPQVLDYLAVMVEDMLRSQYRQSQSGCRRISKGMLDWRQPVLLVHG